MMKSSIFISALVAMAASATVALANPAVTTVETAKGEVLADENGMTLYTFKKDEQGVSNCNGKCAENWPPFFAEDDAAGEGAYSVVEREDGTKQWAKDGMPLYLWVKDSQKGDITGDGVKGVWDLARP